MGDHDSPGTCLSTVPHGLLVREDGRLFFGGDVRDISLHYFGCLREDGKRDDNKFLPPERQPTKSQEKDLRERYQRKPFFDSLPEHKQNRIKDEEERIMYLRLSFAHHADQKGLVKRFETSLDEWRSVRGRTEAVRLQGCLPEEKLPSKKNAFGLSAYMMLFEDNRDDKAGGYTGVRDEAFPENFPNQKIPLKDLLYKKTPDSNPLVRPCKDGMLRYFHLPGNNMEWIEESIARYFGEERPDYDGLFRQPEKPSKSYMILRPGFWRGQQHGGRGDAVHARHMRPRCDIISTNPEHLEDSPNNLVLFMPYLHWETDRSRYRFEESMRNITDYYNTQRKEVQGGRNLPYLSSKEVDEQNRRAREPASKSAKVAKSEAQASDSFVEFLDAEKPLHRLRTPTEMVQARFNHEVKDHPMSKVSKAGVVQELTRAMWAPTTELGRVLYRAAKLSEAMECYQEEQLLKEFLHSNPPYHPRRTLDQSYYWTLQSTKKRDRDQVVYRGTAPNKEFMHKMHCKAKKGDLPCGQCWDDIRKVPRLVMVDQLWLWILDGNTIITSFPKRYGRNKPDPSAVHKSIRLRLKVARKNEIRSIYDLALIIIDECSKVFFDRAKTADRQPQVIDLFAEAIGKVNTKTTIYYDHFWDITRRLSKVYREEISVDDVEEQAKALLDVNPEGDLSREIKDILDELHIMINIKSKQQRVLKDFQKHVEYILAPELAIAKDMGTARVQTVTALMSPANQKADSINTEADKSKELAGPEEKMKMAIRTSSAENAEKDAKWTMELAIRLSADLENRIADLNHLKESAEHTEKAVDGLLSLKQQQASVVQAREAVRQAEETLRQGRSIMLFTVITIIFLPLSFGTSIFGMNLVSFGPSWKLHKEMTYILFVSTIIIATSLILAFSSFVRSLLSLIFGVSWMWVVTTTRIYDFWYSIKQDSGSLTRKQMKVTKKWKEEARKKYLERQREKLKKREAENLKKEKEEAQNNPTPDEAAIASPEDAV